MQNRIGIIGSGWRAEFFLRIAKELPEKFCITSVLVRDMEKGFVFANKHKIKVVNSIDEMLMDSLDYVIVSVKSGFAFSYIEELFKRRIPVLCETPPVDKFEDLNRIWNLKNQYGGKIQVLEQYLFQPLYHAILKIVKTDILGDIQNINLSRLHGYHSVSIIREVLNITFENAIIYGNEYYFNVTATDGRDGFVYNGKIVPDFRQRATFEFENGKVGFHDFTGIQYHSTIRSRHILIQGTRGEIDDNVIRYLNKDNIPVEIELKRKDLGIYDNSSWSHHNIMIGDKVVYSNPFPGARLNDDEIAIATSMDKMGTYIKTNLGFYTLSKALQDTYLSLLMQEAIKSGQQLNSKKQAWSI